VIIFILFVNIVDIERVSIMFYSIASYVMMTIQLYKSLFRSKL